VPGGIGLEAKLNMMNSMTTSFVSRLRKQDQTAWFELWETFGPVLRAQITKWGKGRIGAETVRDLSQETMAALSDSIDRYDPSKGARFSTWLLAIAKHVLGDEIDKRAAQKRGGSGANTPNGTPVRIGYTGVLDDSWMTGTRGSGGAPADQEYEAAMFRAKVHAALRLTERASDFTDFEIFRMRVLEAQSGKQVADAMAMSEPTVSRRMAKVRDVLRLRLSEVMATYCFTEEEMAEITQNGITLDPKQQDDAAFDEAIGELFRRALYDRQKDAD